MEHDATERTASRWHIAVLVESDPSALIRVLGFLQQVNAVPQHVNATRTSRGQLAISVRVEGLSAQTVESIARRIRQIPVVYFVDLEPA